jgi:hypothetical protein
MPHPGLAGGCSRHRFLRGARGPRSKPPSPTRNRPGMECGHSIGSPGSPSSPLLIGISCPVGRLDHRGRPGFFHRHHRAFRWWVKKLHRWRHGGADHQPQLERTPANEFHCRILEWVGTHSTASHHFARAGRKVRGGAKGQPDGVGLRFVRFGLARYSGDSRDGVESGPTIFMVSEQFKENQVALPGLRRSSRLHHHAIEARGICGGDRVNIINQIHRRFDRGPGIPENQIG